MMRSGNIFEREGSRGHGCDGDGTEITGGGDYSGWDKMYDQGSIEIKGGDAIYKKTVNSST